MPGPARWITLTPDFWTRDDVNHALRDRDIGALLRLIQKHTGASQVKIANAVGMTHTMVGAFMNRKRQATSLDVYERIADGLDMPDTARLALGLAPHHIPTPPAPAPPATPAPPPAQPPTHTPPPPAMPQPRAGFANTAPGARWIIHLDDEFWSRPATLAMLTARDVAQLLRTVQRLTAASQTQIGVAIGIAQGEVSHIMSGGPRRRRILSADLLTRIATGLGMPDHAAATLLLGRIIQPPALRTNQHQDQDQDQGENPDDTDQSTMDTPGMTFGPTMRILRRAAGLSTRALADTTNYSHATIGHAETGRRPPTKEFAATLDNALNANGQLIETAAADRTLAREHAAARRVTAPRAFPASPQPSEQFEIVLDHASTDDTSATVKIMSPDGLTELKLTRRAFAELASGLVAASLAGTVAEPPIIVDPAVVDHFAAMRAFLVEADNRLGAVTIHPTVLQQVQQIARFRRNAKGHLRNDLLGAEARWAEFAGWLSDDLGDHAAGTRWLDLAMGMSQEASDVEFVAYILARQAQRAVGTRDEDRVVGLAQAAARQQQDSSLVSAFAAVQEAQGNALAGDPTTFRSAIDQARDIVSAATPNGGDLGSFCTTAYVHAQEAEGWLRLKQPQSALGCFERALAEWPQSYPRERGLCLARTAAAHLSADDPDQAAATAHQALTFAATTQSARIRHEVEAVANRAGKFRRRPAVKALTEALAAEN